MKLRGALAGPARPSRSRVLPGGSGRHPRRALKRPVALLASAFLSLTPMLRARAPRAALSIGQMWDGRTPRRSAMSSEPKPSTYLHHNTACSSSPSPDASNSDRNRLSVSTAPCRRLLAPSRNDWQDCIRIAIASYRVPPELTRAPSAPALEILVSLSSAVRIESRAHSAVMAAERMPIR